MNKAKKLQVVTGGTSGMGLATAKALSVYGPVLIGGRSEKRLEGALAELKEGIRDKIRFGTEVVFVTYTCLLLREATT